MQGRSKSTNSLFNEFTTNNNNVTESSKSASLQKPTLMLAQLTFLMTTLIFIYMSIPIAIR